MGCDAPYRSLTKLKLPKREKLCDCVTGSSTEVRSLKTRKESFALFHVVASATILLVILITQAKAADLAVTDAWIRALPSSVPSGGYFTLHNNSATSIALVGASSPGCGMLMLHKSDNMGGMSSMEDVREVDVPVGGTVKFSPGGYHLMCMDAKPQIYLGASVPVTLSFKGGRNLVISFKVRNAAGH